MAFCQEKTPCWKGFPPPGKRWHKFRFIWLPPEMQNGKYRMQDRGIFLRKMILFIGRADTFILHFPFLLRKKPPDGFPSGGCDISLLSGAVDGHRPRTWKKENWFVYDSSADAVSTVSLPSAPRIRAAEPFSFIRTPEKVPPAVKAVPLRLPHWALVLLTSSPF